MNRSSFFILTPSVCRVTISCHALDKAVRGYSSHFVTRSSLGFYIFKHLLTMLQKNNFDISNG